MKIRIIRPVTSETDDSVIEDQFKAFASPDVVLSATRLTGCPRSIESRVDVAVAAPRVVEAVLAAERDGFDACLVNCFADPGVAAAREVARIPVTGPGESSLAIAMALGTRIGIVTVVRELIPVIIEAARSSGIGNKVVSVRAVDIPVLELEDRPRLLKSFVREAVASIREGAHVIIAGCTGMVGLAKEVRETLLREGYDVPVVDPQGAALALAETFVRLSVYQSKLSYSRPSGKTLNDDMATLSLSGGTV